LPPEFATHPPIITASAVSSSVSSWVMISWLAGSTDRYSLRQERRVSPCLALAHSHQDCETQSVPDCYAPKNLSPVLSMTMSTGPLRGQR
jgi:hypothetical protein